MNWLDEVEQRAQKAISGPWVFDEANEIYAGKFDPEYGFQFRVCTMPYSPDFHNDFKFIAHARTDVPELVARLRAAIKLLRSEAHISHKYIDELERTPEDK